MLLFFGSLSFIIFAPLFLYHAHYGNLLAIILLELSLLAFSYFQKRKLIARDERLCVRHKRFFASFSKINELVLEELEWNVYADSVNLLGNIAIDRLDVREFTLTGNIL